MSLRYTGTGEATMDEPALRDVERWKDKIEVRLDNRQVFFLFFGSAMVACMLFVLGVIVGKRLESRGKAEAPPFEDPLAVLDRFGAMAAPGPPASALTFPRALLGAGTSKTKPVGTERGDRGERERAERGERVERGVAEHAAAERVSAKPPLSGAIATATAAASSGPTQTAASKPTTTVKAPPATATSPATGTGATTGGGPGSAARRAASTARQAPAPVASVPLSAPSAAMPSKRLAALPRPLTSTPLPARPVAAVVASAKEPTQPPKSTVAGIKPGLSPAAGGAQDKPKSRFLLQLSSFQDRAEADAFARRFAAQSAYVVATEIPGKGTWYRVRVGSYGSLQEASAAKTNFERDHNVIAYVAGPGPAR